jgi:pyroglutamyl-peptidase
MSIKILLTSFQTWLPHQVSNSSDDLLAIIEESDFLDSLFFLRQLPVDITQASKMAIATIKQLNPEIILACGMAESRQQLSLESQAIYQNHTLKTAINLEKLVSKLSATFISYDAGKFVCEGLYYHLLKYYSTQCLFIHVPILKPENQDIIIKDFQLIIQEISKGYTNEVK